MLYDAPGGLACEECEGCGRSLRAWNLTPELPQTDSRWRDPGGHSRVYRETGIISSTVYILLFDPRLNVNKNNKCS